ncbi:transcriptional regulator with XRE-family HTH domain [Streptococcus gallinaceus]|uniref:helix-turn-helix domain-containing protein n=1 Tax=Streptococcus gallinaceus TaxID=165758 RepID=UPI00209EEF6E|nr:transcriptional regulator with XRE-family HTH domain [Streptococcus gallinaceus]MCP1769338.1 transcriptional regulator with XRE-family HTH domain [Streptococcus gallinaceus]
MDQNITFGKFVEIKRKELKITLRGLASELEIAPAYMSDIEKGRRYPPEKKLEDIARILHLTLEEKDYLFDLAALEKENTVSSDLPEYIMERDVVRVALRRARDRNLSDEGWQDILNLIDEKTRED